MMVQDREDVRLERPIKEVWEMALEVLSKQVREATFNTWIRPTRLLEITGNEAVIGTCNEFARKWLLENHVDMFASALSQVLARPTSVRIVVEGSASSEPYTPSIASITVAPEPNHARPQDDDSFSPRAQRDQLAQRPESPASRSGSANLNPKYTFDTFVVGSHNRFCHSASMAVADRPGQTYNPLFLYGGVGLGKTHIMHAIGHQILQHAPHTSVKYISCERFTNELINSIRDDRMIDFRKRYRQVDVLLVDDIQFIEGKDATQEEFFHTFNALRDSGRQIVMSSDRPPKALSLLEERLRSRFEWGLIADIQTPDLETRTAILRKKAELERMSVPDEVMQFIASIFTTNIRELEGALIRAHAYASLTSTPLTLQSAAAVLQPQGPAQPKPQLTMERILQAVATHYRVEVSELKSSKRSQDLALPRHVAMYLAHELIQVSFPRIGEAFGGRKHTSALYAYKRVKTEILEEPDLASAVRQISRQLGV